MGVVSRLATSKRWVMHTTADRSRFPASRITRAQRQAVTGAVGILPLCAASLNAEARICDNTEHVCYEPSRITGMAWRHNNHVGHGRTILWGAVSMANVKLFGQTYSLPSMANERFCRLQQQANEQSRLIQAGVRPRPRWLGIARFSS